jgi:hypothetical protein
MVTAEKPIHKRLSAHQQSSYSLDTIVSRKVATVEIGSSGEATVEIGSSGEVTR